MARKPEQSPQDSEQDPAQVTQQELRDSEAFEFLIAEIKKQDPELYQALVDFQNYLYQADDVDRDDQNAQLGAVSSVEIDFNSVVGQQITLITRRLRPSEFNIPVFSVFDNIMFWIKAIYSKWYELDHSERIAQFNELFELLNISFNTEYIWKQSDIIEIHELLRKRRVLTVMSKSDQIQHICFELCQLLYDLQDGKIDGFNSAEEAYKGIKLLNDVLTIWKRVSLKYIDNQSATLVDDLNIPN